MELRSVQSADFEAIRSFLAANGWAGRVADRPRFAKMLENSARAVVAIEAGQIIGFARALCDDVSNGYISMVAVAPEHRRRGIGRKLIETLTGDDPNITWVLRAGRGSEQFWTDLGFQPSEIALERLRKP